jgi:hypothetical protein
MAGTTAYTNINDNRETIILGWDDDGQDVYKIENPTGRDIENSSAHYYSKFPNYAISVDTWEVLVEKAAQLPSYEEWLEQ